MSDLVGHTTLLSWTWFSFRVSLVKVARLGRWRAYQVLLRGGSRIKQRGDTGGRVTQD